MTRHGKKDQATSSLDLRAHSTHTRLHARTHAHLWKHPQIQRHKETNTFMRARDNTWPGHENEASDLSLRHPTGPLAIEADYFFGMASLLF